ncbi:hypothetical protein ACFVKB_33440 [Rhodococcus sp. NPDC127530]|uniref:hypothetical protein n=1 Tax=unclassified Rhodococcus (in: high G+C Gram-positive bacteria) TaxID=192944 RepID=UPI0036284E8A
MEISSSMSSESTASTVRSRAAAALFGAPAAAGADTATLTPTDTIGHGLNPGESAAS